MINIKNYAKSILITFGILLVFIVAYGFIFSGAHGFIQIALWWLIQPLMTCYISSRFKNVNFLVNALVSILLFFSFLYFMTYKHIDTDFGQMMKYAFVSNIVIITVYAFYKCDRGAGDVKA